MTKVTPPYIQENRLPGHPDTLREKANAYRSAAATETKPERRRAYLLIASECDQLADAIEKELGEAPNADERTMQQTQSRRAPKGRDEP